MVLILTSRSEFLHQLNLNEIAIAGATASGAITHANQKFLLLTGYDLAELKHFTYQDITPEAWLIYENQTVIKEVFTYGSAKYQKEFRLKNGDVVPVELEVFVFTDDEDQSNGLWGKVRQIEQLDEKHHRIKQQTV